jgi:hypothetical protein
MSDYERKFWSKVDRSGDCWEWTGAKNTHGYGLMRERNRSRMAHRVAYEFDNGPVPDGRQLDHICLNRRCIKPTHLRVATSKQQAENQAGAQVNNMGSGVRGVYKARSGRFQARATHNGKVHTAGTYDTIPEAESAAIELRLSLFTHNEVDRANLPRIS